MELFFGIPTGTGMMTLPEDESVHCVRVLRHRDDDIISVIDGSGSLYSCRITNASTKRTEAVIESETANWNSHNYQLTMAVCPTKNMDRYEWFVEKATEIGIDEIVPVIGDHSERKVVKSERLDRLVLSATKQSLKGKRPEISDAVSVKDYILSVEDKACNLICYCHDDRIPISEALDCTDGNGKVRILIGPEGDFSEEEIKLALERGWKPVSLGNSRLRTETAAVVAATAVYIKYGDYCK